MPQQDLALDPVLNPPVDARREATPLALTEAVEVLTDALELLDVGSSPSGARPTATARWPGLILAPPRRPTERTSRRRSARFRLTRRPAAGGAAHRRLVSRLTFASPFEEGANRMKRDQKNQCRHNQATARPGGREATRRISMGEFCCQLLVEQRTEPTRPKTPMFIGLPGWRNWQTQRT